MADFVDPMMRDGTDVTSSQCVSADIGINDSFFAAAGRQLHRGRQEISARDRLLTPEGIDPYCHIALQTIAVVLPADSEELQAARSSLQRIGDGTSGPDPQAATETGAISFSCG